MNSRRIGTSGCRNNLPMKTYAFHTRRKFLGISASLTATLALGTRAATRKLSENDKLNIGIIGAGGRGWDNLQGVKTENIVALCDVDDVTAAKAYAAYPDAKRY